MYLRARTKTEIVIGVRTVCTIFKEQKRINIDIYTDNKEELENIQKAIDTFEEIPIPKGYKLHLPSIGKNIVITMSRNITFVINWWIEGEKK